MITSQFILYLFVGIVSATFDVAATQLCLYFGAHYIFSASLGFLAGLFVNVILHSRFTFKKPLNLLIVVRYLCVVALNYIIVLFLVGLSNDILAMPLMGKLLSLPIIAANGYIMGKRWIFKDKSDEN